MHPDQVVRMNHRRPENSDRFERDLGRVAANYQPLTPLSFLEWSASVYPEKLAVIYGERRITWRAFAERCRRLAGALHALGIGRGDTVAVLAPNTPALLEAHFGVPLTGGVLNALNVRLDADSIGYMLEDSEARVILVDRELTPVCRRAIARVGRPLFVVDIDDPLAAQGERIGEIEYEAFLAAGDPGFRPEPLDDEWRAITLNYTSGTTGEPKGVVYHHRGAFLEALGNALAFGLNRQSVYLWTLPMFHCNGWSYPWAVTAVGGTHVCLRRFDPARGLELIKEEGVTHLCGAPTVLTMMAEAARAAPPEFDHLVQIATGGAPPHARLIAEMERHNFRVTHLYGLTESYGPSMYCAPQDDWEDLTLEERAAQMARQGVRLPTLAEQTVLDPATRLPVAWDGASVGEIMLRGNTIMKGYLNNPRATEAAFQGGWFNTGDLAVVHPDGYVEIKDRSKDVIISGGENISSIEVEKCLCQHPSVLEAAVVAKPHEKWGETPCAFVTLRAGADPVSEADLIEWCKGRLPRFKAPTQVVFGPLPKTSTGKLQKFLLREQARASWSREDGSSPPPRPAPGQPQTR